MKTVSNEQKSEFIKVNMGYVPVNRIEVFNSLPIEKQYKRIREYVSKAKRKDNPTFYNSVCKYLKSRNANTTEIIRVSKMINNWINNNDVRRATEIEKQIAKLQSELNDIRLHKTA